MTKILRPTLVLFVALTVVTGVAYPLVVTGIAKAVFPAQAAGSLIEVGGQDGRLGADRPELLGPEKLLGPPVGDQPDGQ